MHLLSSHVSELQALTCFAFPLRPWSQEALPCLSSSVVKRTSEMRFGFSSRCAGRGKKIFSPLPPFSDHTSCVKVKESVKGKVWSLLPSEFAVSKIGYLFGKQAPEGSVRGVFDIRKQPSLADKYLGEWLAWSWRICLPARLATFAWGGAYCRPCEWIGSLALRPSGPPFPLLSFFFLSHWHGAFGGCCVKLGASNRLPIGAQKCCSSVPDSTAAASLDINTALLPIYWEIIFTKRRGLRSYESPSTLSGS